MAVQGTQRRYLSRLAGGVFALLLIVGFIWFVRAMMAGKVVKAQRQVEMVQIIRPPPPPPPDEPPPPPPPKADTPLPRDEPTPAPDNTPAPANQPLGIDAEGAAGGDAFGLAARAGGSELIGGTGGAPYAWYTTRVADAIRERLSGLACAKAAHGSLSMHVMVDAEGKIKQVQLASTTGNDKVDQCIASGLSGLPSMNDRPPPGMPEQITVRVVARN